MDGNSAPLLEASRTKKKIDLRIAPALETLKSLPSEPVLDLAFIDADKTGYPLYYEELLVPRMRPGGLLILDNVLRSGRVLDPTHQAESDIAMRRMNEIIVNDPG